MYNVGLERAEQPGQHSAMTQLLSISIETRQKLSAEEKTSLQNMVQLLIALQCTCQIMLVDEIWYSETSVALIIALMGDALSRQNVQEILSQYAAFFSQCLSTSQSSSEVCEAPEAKTIQPPVAPPPPASEPVLIQSKRKPSPGPSPLRQSYTEADIGKEKEAELIAEITRMSQIYESCHDIITSSQHSIKEDETSHYSEHLRIEAIYWNSDTLPEFVIVEECPKKRGLLVRVRSLVRKVERQLTR